MGEIEHVGMNFVPVERPSSGMAPRATVDASFAGEPVGYVSARFTPEESWQILSPRMRQWAEGRAGEAIRDPHTGEATVYWYCRVRPEGVGGPVAAAVSATYELLVFGRRGLIVSTGTTTSFDAERGGTRWRHQRFDMPVDPSAIRNDHRIAPAHRAGDDAMLSSGWTDGGSIRLLPADVARMFGNLPSATQRFLLEPFIMRGKQPVEAGVHPTTDVIGRTYRETYRCYLFDAHWVAFANAHRSVPLTSGRTGPALWNGSPEAEALRQAPWTVAAWVAPVLKPVEKSRSVVRG